MLLKRVSGVVGWQIAGTALAFLYQLLLARFLPVADYGALIYFLTWLGFLAMVVKLGFDNACMRYVASYMGQGEWGKVSGLLIIAFSVTGFFSFLFAWLINLYSTQWFGIAKEYTELLPWLLIILPVIVFQNLIGSVLRGLHAQLTAVFLEGAFRSLLLILLVLLAWWYTPTLQTGTVLDQYAAATVTTVLVGLVMVYVKCPSNFAFVRPKFLYREWFSTSAALWFSGGMYLVQSQADILMLGVMRTSSEVAYYGVASRITGVLSMGLVAVTAIIAPKLAEMHGQNRPKDEFQRYLREGSRLLLRYTLVVGSGLVLLGKPILWLFGEEYMVGYWILVILVIGHGVNSAAGPVGQLMAMTGHHWAASRILLLSTALNLIMNALFIPLWGALGAATATAVSFAVWNIALLIYAWRRLGLNPSILPDYFVKASAPTTSQ